MMIELIDPPILLMHFAANLFKAFFLSTPPSSIFGVSIYLFLYISISLHTIRMSHRTRNRIEFLLSLSLYLARFSKYIWKLYRTTFSSALQQKRETKPWQGRYSAQFLIVYETCSTLPPEMQTPPVPPKHQNTLNTCTHTYNPVLQHGF